MRLTQLALPLALALAVPLAACGHAAPKAASTTPVARTPKAVVGATPAVDDAPVDPDAALERGRAANDALEYETAVSELETALAIFERELEPTDITLDDVMSELGYAYQGLRRWADAEDMLTRRLDLARESGDRAREATALDGLARSIKRSGDLHRAVALFKEALAIDAALGIKEDDANHLDRLHGLANAYDDLGDHARAIVMLEQVLDLERAKDPSSARTATVSHNLGLAYRDDGQLEEARTMFETALRIRIVLDGPNHQSVVSPLNGLAGTLKLMGEREDAVRTFKRVIALAGKDTGIRAIALADLGDTEVELGQLDEGIAHLDEALAFLKKAYPSGHAEIVRTLVKRTAAMLAAKRLPEANQATEEAIRMATALDREEGTRASATLSWLADVWQDWGHAKRARELRKQMAAKQPAKRTQVGAKRAAKR